MSTNAQRQAQAHSAELELLKLRSLAESQAKTRRERVTSAHLLAAIALQAGPAAELLQEHKLTGERLLRAARSSTDEQDQPLRRALQAAREVAHGMKAREPNAAHLLIALLNDLQSAAHKALDQAGVDIVRLRKAAVNLGLGLAGRQLLVERMKYGEERSQEIRTQNLVPSRRGAGVTVSLFPPRNPAASQEEMNPSRSPRAPGPRQGLSAPQPSGAQAPRREQGLPSSASEASGASPARGLAGREQGSSAAPARFTDSAAKPQSATALKAAGLSAPKSPSENKGEGAGQGSPRLSIKKLGRAAKGQAPGVDEKNSSGKLVGRGVAVNDKPVKGRGRGQTARFALDPKRQPALSSLGRNLSLAAERGELDPVVARDAEIQQLLDVLAKRQANNPCLIGPSGVGKTSIVRGLAQYLVQHAGEDEEPRILVELPVGELLAGTGVRGALAQRVGQLRKEIAEAGGRIILFFDEVHQLFSSDIAEELASELKLSLSRGELPCIGATSDKEYQKLIASDAALARRFSKVEVHEPSKDDAVLTLQSLAAQFEEHHQVRYAEEALKMSVTWSMRYLPSQMLPDKAISIVDLAGARVKRRGKELVDLDAVAEVVSELGDVPMERLLQTDQERFLGLEALLAERVVGHEAPLSRIARILRRNGAGLNTKRPIGTFLLLGPTGVGKTETAKAIAEVLFYSENSMTRLDMSEYSEAHAVARLIGAPPGYVGHEAGGQLTEAVRRRPYQVLLLDEIEKAHKEVLETFLQVFDEGRLTDSRGRTVDFTNTVILITSNLGVAAAADAGRRKVGFNSRTVNSDQEAAAWEAEERAMLEAARASLSPELYNRLDEVVAFKPLSRLDVREIAHRMLADLGARLFRERQLRLELTEEVLDQLLDEGGFEPSLGARPMKRCIARLIEAPLAECILAGQVVAGDTIVLRLSEQSGVIDLSILPQGKARA